MEMQSNPSRAKAKTSHHNVRIFLVVTLAVTLCYPALIDTAAVVRSEKQLQRVLLRDLTNVRIPRATEDSDEENAPRRICHNAPCGWVVYNPYTRNIEYFMRNTCECPDESYKCVRVGDDLSASAYVYRCRQNTTAEDIESPSLDDTL
ncbi:PREDICTED: uncharacterized protein LOC108767018 [Trachymyrmex cornetzi]|uniref:Uncharacterized protein n=1 Tax=Trachymyrmex cornetzi TaxID=471704 RepID=A0A195DIZ0_9HYME|nr:PREDICTED: uncharacterized protein LOC108767018 [Trachymyrmex cornetzi]KYN12811.1 hypothetical protein ALC57_14876 [Trachymyrmex cornetzi]